jgi:enoyl-CoA hydratase/carnithine racemase
MAPSYNYEYFNVTFPGEYVAQVEINRPEKMNAFNETYVRTYSLTITTICICLRPR